MILQPAAQVRELDRRDRTGKPPIFVGMELLFARIDQDAVAIDIALIVERLVGLLPVVESHALRPDVLIAFPLFLRIVAPVHRVPVQQADVGLLDKICRLPADGQALAREDPASHFPELALDERSELFQGVRVTAAPRL